VVTTIKFELEQKIFVLESIFNKKYIICFAALILLLLSPMCLNAGEKSRQKKESLPFAVKNVLFKVNNLLNKNDVPGAIKVRNLSGKAA